MSDPTVKISDHALTEMMKAALGQYTIDLFRTVADRLEETGITALSAHDLRLLADAIEMKDMDWALRAVMEHKAANPTSGDHPWWLDNTDWSKGT